MIFRLTAFLLLSFLFVMSGNNAFASKPVPPHVCGGYNEEGETCAAVCQVGESAICISRNGANAPKCSCGPENGGQSLTDFLHKLKAVVKQEDVFNNNDKSVQMIENITLEVGTDVSPDGKLSQQQQPSVIWSLTLPHRPYFVSLRLPILCSRRFP